MALYFAHKGKEVRELLTPIEPMQTEPTSHASPATAVLAAEQSALLAAMCEGEDMGFDLFD